MALPKVPSITGGAGGNAGPSEAGGHLSNPFATGDMAVSFGGNAGTSMQVPLWLWGAVALGGGLWLWKRSK